jgi:hypothetical protein
VRSRQSITLAEKLHIVKYRRDHQLSYDKTARMFSVPRSCIQEWVKKEELMKQCTDLNERKMLEQVVLYRTKQQVF